MSDVANTIVEGASVVNRIANLSNLEITDELTIKIIGVTCVIGASIAAICFVCSLGFNYVKSALKNLFNIEEPGEFPNYMEIARGFLFILMISVYPILAVGLAGTVEFFNKISSPVYENNRKMAELANSYSGMIRLSYDDAQKAALEAAKAGKIGDSHDQEAAEYQLQQGGDADIERESAPLEDVNDESLSIRELLSLLNPSTWIALTFQAGFHLLLGIVRIVICTIAAILFKFFIIIGPLAIAFSILPVFEKQISIWFGTVLNTGFVFTTLNILDHISLGMFEYILEEGADGILFPNYVITFDIVLLVVYLSAFWLTSKYVGKGDAGRIMSKMVGIATAAAALMTGGASAAATGGNLANAVNAGKNTIES